MTRVRAVKGLVLQEPEPDRHLPPPKADAVSRLLGEKEYAPRLFIDAGMSQCGPAIFSGFNDFHPFSFRFRLPAFRPPLSSVQYLTPFSPYPPSRTFPRMST